MTQDPFLGNKVAHEFEIALERFVISQAISPHHWILTAKARNFWAVEMDALILQISVDVPRISLEELIIPKTWWEHTKERWAPKWFTKRWPVKYRLYEGVALLEKLPIPAKELESKFGFIKLGYMDRGTGKLQ